MTPTSIKELKSLWKRRLPGLTAIRAANAQHRKDAQQRAKMKQAQKGAK